MANLIGLALFLIGSRYYRRDKPRGSPFTSLIRVIVASFRKRKAAISSAAAADYYYGGGDGVVAEAPTKRFRYSNYFSVVISFKY